MCQLCGDTREAALKGLDMRIYYFNNLEALYRQVQDGTIMPHEDKMKRVIEIERHIVKLLIMDVL